MSDKTIVYPMQATPGAVVYRQQDETVDVQALKARVAELERELAEAMAQVAELSDAVNYALGTANCHWDNDALARLSAAMLYTNDAARRHDAEVSARTLEEAADMKGQLEMIERGETMSDYLSRLAAEKRKEEPK